MSIEQLHFGVQCTCNRNKILLTRTVISAIELSVCRRAGALESTAFGRTPFGAGHLRGRARIVHLLYSPREPFEALYSIRFPKLQ